MEKSYRFYVSGLVQGVFYRKNVEENARKHGFSGYVRNMLDGRVEAVSTMEEHRLEEFLEILRKGSPSSVVERVETEEIKTHYEGIFEIRYK